MGGGEGAEGGVSGGCGYQDNLSYLRGWGGGGNSASSFLVLT